MAFRERTVTGIVVDGDGTPVETGTVQFKPTKSVGYTSTHVVIDRVFTAETDTNGEFSVTLWCDEDSLKAIDYIVTFPIENNGQPSPLHFEVISLAYEAGTPKDVGTLIAESQPPPSEVPEETWAALIDSRIGNASIDALGDVVIDNMSLADGDVLTWNDVEEKWVNLPGGGGGGIAIGGAVTGGTSGSIPFIDSSGDLAEDNANLFWDDTNDRLRIPAIQLPSGTTLGLRDNAGGLAGSITLQAGGFPLGITSAGWLVLTATYGTQLVTPEGLYISGNLPTQIPLTLQLAASQSANAFQVLPNGSGTPLTFISANGAFSPVSLADGAAPNGVIYYSTTASKLVYKDAGGTVNNLY